MLHRASRVARYVVGSGARALAPLAYSLSASPLATAAASALAAAPRHARHFSAAEAHTLKVPGMGDSVSFNCVGACSAVGGGRGDLGGGLAGGIERQRSPRLHSPRPGRPPAAVPCPCGGTPQVFRPGAHANFFPTPHLSLTPLLLQLCLRPAASRRPSRLCRQITEGALVKWFKKVGDYVALDEVILCIETDKVRCASRALCGGRLFFVVPRAPDTLTPVTHSPLPARARSPLTCAPLWQAPWRPPLPRWGMWWLWARP